MHLFREPLAHFAIAGALLFALHGWIRPAEDAAVAPVRIGTDEIRWLEQTFTRQWQRGPTGDELRRLVTELLREELLSREGRALGLEEHDTIIRRRLAQKVEFVVQGMASLDQPAEPELRRYHDEHPEKFVEPRRISFEHVLFSASRRADPDADARLALARLDAANGGGAGGIGDPSLLPGEIDDRDEHAIAGEMGAEFAAQVFAVAPGEWTGPVLSPYGAHLVRVTAVTPQRRRTFEDARADVVAAWQAERQTDADRRFFEELLARYPIVVDEEARPLVGAIDGARLIDVPRGDEESVQGSVR